MPTESTILEPAGMTASEAPPARQSLANRIRNLLRDMQYGEITIKVHDGKVVFIERMCKTRLKSPNSLKY